MPDQEKNLNIKKLALHDYRCFANIEISFHKQLTVLVAANGEGKTSILDAVAVALGPFIGSFDEGIGKHFLPKDIRLLRVRETATNEMEYAPQGVRLEATGNIPGSVLEELDIAPTWERSLAGPGKKTTIKGTKELIGYAKRLQRAVRTPGEKVTLPLLAYYGTGRLWQHKKLTLGKLPRKSRTIGYSDCLDPASSYKSFVAWFRYWSTNSLKAQIDAYKSGQSNIPTEFDQFIRSVSGAVDVCLEPVGWKNITYSLGREELVAHHEIHGELSVDILSDGIRNMIGMVADIAFRATKLNPDFGPCAASMTPGIVLIDEVDMHLHPAWQQVVVQSLTKAFPKLQFIVTTHSPQVLTTVPRENIRVIELTESGYQARMPDFSPLAHESGDALAKVMRTHREPPLPIQEQIRQFEQLVRAGLEASDEAKELGTILSDEGYQIHDSDLATWRFLASRKSDKTG
ncbi:MAG: AAA family ATPase [Methylococcus sp.]